MKIAIIGGGINGLASSWKLASKGFEVDLYEESEILSQTSSSSSKLLHGGIRYLEYGHFKLVHESLLDRHKWLKMAPQFCKPIKIIIPLYKNSNRPSWILFLGTFLYKILAGRYSLGPNSWLSKKDTLELCPDIDSKKLKGSISFYDAQMNEDGLGNWVKEQASNNGVKIFDNTPINSFSREGMLEVGNKKKRYDFIINATGPWAEKNNIKNNIKTEYSLELIRGSHLLIDKKISNPFIFQELTGKRVVFVLPYLKNTLIGTTEVKHDLDSDNIQCSSDERDYLINLYNSKFSNPITKQDIISEFSGLRPIVKKKDYKRSLNFIAASRESAIEVDEKVLTIYGGKWTSAPSLSDKVFLKIKELSKKI